MSELVKAEIFVAGQSQAVLMPAEFRFSGTEVYIRRDAASGDVILSQTPRSLAEILAALDELGVPDDFLSPGERAQGPPQQRSEL